MATLEELQRQVEMLQQTVDALTTPPTDYYTHRWSGEEIDRGIDRAKEGGALDVALSNKATNYRIISGVDLLDWALDQGIGGTFLTDLTVTELPVQGYFNGLLTVAGQDRGLMIWDQHANCYSRNTVSGGWSGSEWIKYATATPLQEYDMPLTGATGTCKYNLDQFGGVRIAGLITRTLDTVYFGTLPEGYRPVDQVVFASCGFDDGSTIFPCTVGADPDGRVWVNDFGGSFTIVPVNMYFLAASSLS